MVDRHRLVGKLVGRRVVSLLAIARSPAAARATEAHRRLLLPDPTIEDVIRYSKAPTQDYEALAAERFVESILDVRERPLPCSIKRRKQDFADEILAEMKLYVQIEDRRTRREFEGAAKSISRLIALYYDEDGRQPEELEDTRLAKILPYLARHLLAETQLCIEAKFTYPKRNLSKVSVFDIQKKLEALEKHNDEVVRDNARNIVCAGLNRGNLGICDELASRAQAKLKELEGHGDEVVRDNARTIVSAGLNKGNLELCENLASSAKEKLKELEGHEDEVVREHARTIVCAGLNKGNLELCENLASGTRAKVEVLKGHPNERVRRNARTITSELLRRGNLGLESVEANGETFVLES